MAQGVGINTSDVDNGSALQIDSHTGSLVLPRMTTAQMNLIPTPLDGAVIFNTTEQNWFIRINGIWAQFVFNDTPSVILNKDGGTNEIVLNSIPQNFPLDSNNMIANNTDYFSVSSVNNGGEYGEVKVLRDGNYLINAGFSTSELPKNPRKYKMLVYVNGVLKSYLSTGNVNLPNEDYWGTSGNSILLLNENDEIQLKYILEGSGTKDARFFNIGISKL